ncbi:MAG: hypothetical protein WBV96_10270, partial [Polyangia bacterium]
FLLGGRQGTRRAFALVHVCLPTPVVHQAVCRPKVLCYLRDTASCTDERHRVCLELARVCMRRVRFFFWSNTWSPFYAHFPERGCPPNRVKPKPSKLRGADEY